MRHFAKYPRDRIYNAYYAEAGTPAWDGSVLVKFGETEKSLPYKLWNLAARAYNGSIWRLSLHEWLYHRPITFEPCDAEALRKPADLVYSVAFSNTGLALVDHLLATMPADVPLLQYFLDYQITPGIGGDRCLRRVIARANEIWALTDEIAQDLSRIAGSVGKIVNVRPGFHFDLPSTWKQVHRPVDDGDFTCIILGNFWLMNMAPIVKRIWGKVQRAITGLGPIHWLCDPESVQRTCNAMGAVEPEIRPLGFFSGTDLLERLVGADMAIIPFNTCCSPENLYARYSLPSRLTELLSVGLPVFCIAGVETPLARYISRHGLGPVSDAENEERLTQRIVEFVTSCKQRSAAGYQGRQFAEREFPLEPFQEFLYAKLAHLASHGADVPQMKLQH